MSTTSSRLDAIAATLQTANARDFDLRYGELMDTMRVRQLSKDDFNKLVPEAIDAFQRDIVREAMLLSQEAHNGDEIRIFGYCGLAAAVVVIPPRAGVLSAVGVLTGPEQQDLVRSRPDPADHTGLDEALAQLAEEARTALGPGFQIAPSERMAELALTTVSRHANHR